MQVPSSESANFHAFNIEGLSSFPPNENSKWENSTYKSKMINNYATLTLCSITHIYLILTIYKQFILVMVDQEPILGTLGHLSIRDHQSHTFTLRSILVASPPTKIFFGSLGEIRESGGNPHRYCKEQAT